MHSLSGDTFLSFFISIRLDSDKSLKVLIIKFRKYCSIILFIFFPNCALILNKFGSFIIRIYIKVFLIQTKAVSISLIIPVAISAFICSTIFGFKWLSIFSQPTPSNFCVLYASVIITAIPLLSNWGRPALPHIWSISILVYSE